MYDNPLGGLFTAIDAGLGALSRGLDTHASYYDSTQADLERMQAHNEYLRAQYESDRLCDEISRGIW